jgi:hypothetical protein
MENKIMSEPVSTFAGVTALTAFNGAVALVFGPNISAASLVTCFIGTAFYVYRNHKAGTPFILDFIALIGWFLAALYVTQGAHWLLTEFAGVSVPDKGVPMMSGTIAWLAPTLYLALPKWIKSAQPKSAFPWIQFKEDK